MPVTRYRSTRKSLARRNIRNTQDHQSTRLDCSWGAEKTIDGKTECKVGLGICQGLHADNVVDATAAGAKRLGDCHWITYAVREFIDVAFGYVNLNWQDYVEFNHRYLRPAEDDRTSSFVRVLWRNSHFCFLVPYTNCRLLHPYDDFYLDDRC